MAQMSELFGRRLTVIVSLVFGGAFLYPSFIKVDKIWPAYIILIGAIYASCSLGPAYMLELVNSTHGTFLCGVAYQLGNLISSASVTIEAGLGENFPLEEPRQYDYGKVMCIFCGVLMCCLITIIFFGPERFHKNSNVHAQGTNEESSVGSTVDSVKERV